MSDSKQTISNNLKYNTITSMRSQGMTWGVIGAIYNNNEGNIQKWFKRFENKTDRHENVNI